MGETLGLVTAVHHVEEEFVLDVWERALSHEAPQRRPAAVGVVLPVHDEEALLPGALDALGLPSTRCHSNSAGSPSCSTVAATPARPSQIAGPAFRHLVIRQECGVLGWLARPGAMHSWPAGRRWTRRRSGWRPPMLIPVSRGTGSRCSCSPHAGVDLWAGRVQVGRAERYGTEVERALRGRRRAHPRRQPWLHRRTVRALGGFRSLANGEDRDLHHRAMAAGFRIRHDSQGMVMTSSRRQGRAPEGFAGVLEIIEKKELEATA